MTLAELLYVLNYQFLEELCEISHQILKQIQLARNVLHKGDRIVYGVAGSGKTVILMSKAIQLAEMHILDPNYKILVVCYNKPLKELLKPQSKIQKHRVAIRTAVYDCLLTPGRCR